MYEEDMEYIQKNMGYSSLEANHIKKNIDSHDESVGAFEWDAQREQMLEDILIDYSFDFDKATIAFKENLDQSEQDQVTKQMLQ